MELFAEIRREFQSGVGTIKGIARKLGVHRRVVRQALADATPPARLYPPRVKPRLAPVQGLTGRQVCVPQTYDWGHEAQVDWYEAVAVLDGDEVTLPVFCLRSMASGGAFPRA